MGDVIKFTGKRLSGFIPEQNDGEVPEPAATTDKPKAEPKPDSDFLPPPDDCA